MTVSIFQHKWRQLLRGIYLIKTPVPPLHSRMPVPIRLHAEWIADYHFLLIKRTLTRTTIRTKSTATSFLDTGGWWHIRRGNVEHKSLLTFKLQQGHWKAKRNKHTISNYERQNWMTIVIMRAYQIGSSNLPSGFNHSFEIMRYELREFSKEDFCQVYLWFPKNREQLATKHMGETFIQPEDSLPQAALIWTADSSTTEDESQTKMSGNKTTEPSPMIVVDGNHRSTLFLSDCSDGNDDQHQKTIKVVVFQVAKSEYSYYEDLLHSNYLDCLYGHLRPDDLREQHLEMCKEMFSSSSTHKDLS